MVVYEAYTQEGWEREGRVKLGPDLVAHWPTSGCAPYPFLDCMSIVAGAFEMIHFTGLSHLGVL